jgi:hypothetical protein
MRGRSSPYEELDVAGDHAYAPPETPPQDWNTRRLGCDLYHLGSLVSFFFAGVGTTALLLRAYPSRPACLKVM